MGFIKSKPLPFEYFETIEEASFTNQENGLSCYKTYVEDFKEWKRQNLISRRLSKPMELVHLFKTGATK